MKILGIDPGTTRAGYGSIESIGNRIELADSGLLEVLSADRNERLLELARSYSALLERERPELVALEELFFSKNVKTAIDVAQARGVLLMITAQYGVPVMEFTPSEVKAGIAGSGTADKIAVATMVKRIVGAKHIAGPDDVTDAIAIAIVAASHAQWGRKTAS